MELWRFIDFGADGGLAGGLVSSDADELIIRTLFSSSFGCCEWGYDMASKEEVSRHQEHLDSHPAWAASKHRSPPHSNDSPSQFLAHFSTHLPITYGLLPANMIPTPTPDQDAAPTGWDSLAPLGPVLLTSFRPVSC